MKNRETTMKIDETYIDFKKTMKNREKTRKHDE